MINFQFVDRIYFFNCLFVDFISIRLIYFGDIDGLVGVVLFVFFVMGYLGIMAEGENFFSQLFNIEDEVFNVLLRENFNE